MCSSHDTTLQNALKVGRDLGAALPQEITIVAVEAHNVYDFSEQLSPEVAAAIPSAVHMVIDLLGG
jgi:hydrogenase maturation protease